MKICIIGGGTAGWLAANYINLIQPSHKICVIESTKIGIIGAGEGSTGVFTNLLHGGLKIDFQDFLVGAGATQKLGIRFHNWKGDGRSFIAPIDNTTTGDVDRYGWDTSLMYHLKLYGNANAYSSTVNGVLAAKGLSTVHNNKKLLADTHSYHFDGHKVGQFLKGVLQKKLGNELELIDSEVVDVKKDEQGNVSSVKLSNGQDLAADIWIDASGFARVLSRHMNNGWHSYQGYLNCNTAIPFLLPHQDRIDPLTEAYAMNAGWMWQIPTQERRGCGYVFDRNFISEDQAIGEVEQRLSTKIDPIKVIKFEPGRCERTFVKNTVAIGLTQSFLEPLQATSIHGTIGILYTMINFWLRPNSIATEQEAEKLNIKVASAVDHFADLIQLHYKSDRNDTEFWRAVQSLPERPFLTYLREVGARRWVSGHDWTRGFGAGYGVFIYPLIEYGWVGNNLDIDDSIGMTLSSIQEKYQSEQRLIQNIEQYALDHTVLVNRLKNNQSIMDTSRMIDPNLLHPLLRF